jgi:hypothetical protein
MNKFTSLFAATLILASASAWSAADGSADLRYCLDLKSNAEIAKCAGETAAGNKGQPYTKEHAEDVASQEKANAPAGASESPTQPTTPPVESNAAPAEPAAAPPEPVAVPVEPAAGNNSPAKDSSQEY